MIFNESKDTVQIVDMLVLTRAHLCIPENVLLGLSPT